MTKNKYGLPHHHGNDEERIISRLPSQETIDDVSILLKQLSDPTRLKIFWILCHMEECVINIAAIMDMSSPAISHHLRLLKACGLDPSLSLQDDVLWSSSSRQQAFVIAPGDT